MPRAMLAFLVVGCVFVTLSEGAKFGCTSTTDSKNHGLKVIQDPDVNKDFCESLETHNTVENIMGKCELFCGQGTVPFMVGIPTHGFPLGDIDQICLPGNDTSSAVMTFDPTGLRNCKSWASALNRIKMRTAEFVAALDNMTYAELIFRSCIEEAVTKLTEAVASPETKETIMMVSKESDMMPTYVDLINAHLSELLSDGKCRRDLRAAMTRLKVAGETLKDAMDNYLPSVRKYFNSCDRMLVATGTSNEYLLDVCNVRSPNCLAPDDVDSKHVACCCGVVPVTGKYSIENTNRRLSDAEPEALVDVCGEASASFKSDKATKTQILQQTSYGKKVLSEYEAALKNSYPDFSACDKRRLVGVSSGVSQDLEDASKSDGSDIPLGKRSRRLQKLTGCEPQRATLQGTSETLRAAFWKDTETDYCSKLTDADGLMNTCKAFCGRNSVPLLMGSTAFGFNQSGMDSVCLEPGEPVSLASDTVDKCHKDANSLLAVQTKSAKFIADLNVLEARKVEFEAGIKATVKRMTKDIKDKAADKINDAEVGKKIDALQTLLKDLTSELTSGSVSSGARFHLTKAADSLGKSSDELQAQLDVALPALEDLLTNCDRLFTGIGSEQEYLLDLCSQTSTMCIEKDTGRHAGCCCGYMPLLALGFQNVPVHTIPGLSGSLREDPGAEIPRARVAARRLKTSEPVFHTCAESELLSKDQVDEAEANVKELGFDYLFTDVKVAKSAKYPEYYTCPTSDTSTCAKNTGGTCNFLSGCDESRNAECRDGKCVCGGDACVDATDNGRCCSGPSCVKEMKMGSAKFQRPTVLVSLLGVAGCLTWCIP